LFLPFRIKTKHSGQEVTTHWTPITEFNIFMQRVYCGSSNRHSFSKTNACPYCLQIFFPSGNKVEVDRNTTNMDPFLNHLENGR